MKKRIKGLFRHLRRKYYFWFNMDYILKSMEKRKGRCLHCGLCCRLKINGCNFFNDPDCLIWNHHGFEALPFDCKIYPFDEKDMNPETKGKCGFWWL